jgi:hypothetical protein
MKNQWFRKALPYIAAVLVFITLTVVYFSPLMEGKSLKQHDIAMFKGASKEIKDYREKTGDEALWTNSMFGGMPAWQISVRYSSNIIKYIDNILTLGFPRPANFFFLYFIGFFILLLVLRINPWISLIGSIAFAFSSYFLIILGAGHNTKAHAIAYMAPVLAGVIWAYRGEIWKGSILFAIALSLEINANHYQITYYLLFIIIFYGIYRLIESIKNKQLPVFAKTTVFLIVAAVFAVLTNITNLWATYEYAKYTQRGKPELTKAEHIKSGGLDKDYITAWSYGIGETWSLLIPDVKGGASGYLGNVDALKSAAPEYRKAISQQNAYWGDQPGTSGPVYIGAVIMFLFILGMFIIKDKLKWVLFWVTILSVLLSWGKNFMPLTDFFIDFVPGYNKFRTVSMILVIAELAIPVVAFMAVNEIFKNPDIIKEKIKGFYISLGLTVGIILIFLLSPTTFFNFFSQYELQQFNLLKQQNPGQIESFMRNLEEVRVSIFRSDALRSLLFIVVSAGLIWFYSIKKVGKTIFLVTLAMLTVADLFPVNKRYLNNDNFERKTRVDNQFNKTAADKYILKDTDPDYRVLDITKNVFNDASTSYFHKSIGGYHAAKLLRYQDLIDFYLSPEIQKLGNTLKNNPTEESINNTLKKLSALNMLNTKYIIFNPGAPPIINPYAFGHAWFVNNYDLVSNADEEIDKIGKVNLKTTAIIDEKFSEYVKGKTFKNDDKDEIVLQSYLPNKLVYGSNTKNDRLVVFSEIYYPAGWNAYIDGKESPYFRADYVLRAMVVPAGKHTIEFKFEPKIWTVGNAVSLITSLTLILLAIVLIVKEFKRKKSVANK